MSGAACDDVTASSGGWRQLGRSVTGDERGQAPVDVRAGTGDHQQGGTGPGGRGGGCLPLAHS